MFQWFDNRWYLLLLTPFVLLILSFIFFMMVGRLQYGKLPRVPERIKRGNFFKRIFWDFPKQFAYDMYHKNPDEFQEYGFHLLAGEQGCGKTVALTELLMHLKKQYPKCKIATNYGYREQDGEINHWKDLVFNNNGEKGQIDVIDEIQNWFNSLQSKDFPIEMITEITQQRKQRKILFGTSQEFHRVAKPLRDKVNFLYEPMTILGCLTIVRVSKPKLNDDGSIVKKRHHKIYFFVHNKEIRGMFDTYRKVEKMAEEGFSPRDFGNEVIVQTKKSGLFRRK